MKDKKRVLTGRKGRLRTDLEEDKMEEMKDSPTVDLSAEVLEQATLINNVADISKNLKGTSVKVLRDAAATIKAAITVLADRTQNGNYDADRELDRREINKLQEEVRELKKKKESEEEMKKEIKKLQEERLEMLKEMATMKKLIQDLCEAPIQYPP